LLFIGLTGGIGSGKSEALATFGRLGAATLSSDQVVHDLLGTEEVRDLLVARWGDAVLAGEAIDRGAVAQIAINPMSFAGSSSRSSPVSESGWRRGAAPWSRGARDRAWR
jgi:hypothetical protein